MTTFVLVHGAWHGGWCYKRVARLLRQAGHEVYTPTLTGLGDRAHLINRAINLDTQGKSMFDYLPAERSAQMRTDAAQNGEGYKITPIPAAAFAVNAKDAAWVDAMSVKHPRATLEQKLAFRSPQVPKRVYMFAAGWEPPPYKQFGARYKDDRDWPSASPAATT